MDEVQEALNYQDALDQERLGTESQSPVLAKPSADEETEASTDKKLSKQTKARAEALSELYALCTGDDTPTRAIRVQLQPGGPPVEDDLRLVVHLQVQAWVSPEEVRNVYRSVREGLLEEKERIQAKPSTLEIAAFVWRQWRQAEQEGRNRPSCSTLKKLWLRSRPGDKRVQGHGDFPRYFRRAAQAAIPRYRDILFPSPEGRAVTERILQKLDAVIEKHDDTPLDEINQA